MTRPGSAFLARIRRTGRQGGVHAFSGTAQLAAVLLMALPFITFSSCSSHQTFDPSGYQLLSGFDFRLSLLGLETASSSEAVAHFPPDIWLAFVLIGAVTGGLVGLALRGWSGSFARLATAIMTCGALVGGILFIRLPDQFVAATDFKSVDTLPAIGPVGIVACLTLSVIIDLSWILDHAWWHAEVAVTERKRISVTVLLAGLFALLGLAAIAFGVVWLAYSVTPAS